MKHLLDIDDLTPAELGEILKLGARFAEGELPSDGSSALAGSSALDRKGVLAKKGVGLLFEKASLRTRHSMEMAVFNLGGHPVSATASEMGMGLRESPSDIAKTLSGYYSCIGARVFEHASLVEMAEAAAIPVFNMLSDVAHPLQALADLLTVEQVFGKLEGIKFAYIGDANNVAHSLALSAKAVGMSFHIASPDGYGFSDSSFTAAGNDTAAKSNIFSSTNPSEAVADADVVYTDVWTSMGQEKESSKREKAFKGFCVNQELMAQAKPEAIFLHCLPAHRGQEVEAEVIDGEQSKVWQQAQNRMYSAMGFLAHLFGESSDK